MPLVEPSLDRFSQGLADPNEEDSLFGVDYFGDEIFYDDIYYDIDGEFVLEENIGRFLIEVIGAEKKVAGN